MQCAEQTREKVQLFCVEKQCVNNNLHYNDLDNLTFHMIQRHLLSVKNIVLYPCTEKIKQHVLYYKVQTPS